MFEQRQGSSCFNSIMIAAIYGFRLPLAQHHPLHLLLAVLCGFMTIGNANHAGIPFLGYNPMVSANGKYLGYLFTPF
jgi:hypothetical protein